MNNKHEPLWIENIINQDMVDDIISNPENFSDDVISHTLFNMFEDIKYLMEEVNDHIPNKYQLDFNFMEEED
jgi:hypothetical protein